jgi:hypothetical protein
MHQETLTYQADGLQWLNNARWGQFLITPALFTKLVYEGV